MTDGQGTPEAHLKEWISTSVSPVDSPVHSRRQRNQNPPTELHSMTVQLYRRKNRQRRNKARKQRQLAESSAMKGTEADSGNQQKDVEERKSAKDMSVDWFDPEVEEGNVEYKLKIKDPNSVRFQQLVTQMKFRLSEGNGECYYCVGVADDGYPRGLPPEELQQSVDGVFQMAALLHAKAEIKWQFTGGYGRECTVIKVVRSLHERLDAAGIRIGVIGSMDVGKSTLIACLTNGDDGEPLLDNGQGSARTNVLRHKHEIETGHTSTVTKHFLGYQADGQVLNYSGLSTMTPAEIGLAASQRVNLIDMGGQEKFLKTVFRGALQFQTLSMDCLRQRGCVGLTSMAPDYALVCISAIAGLGEIIFQQIAVALALEIPLIFAITKTDIATEEASNQVVASIKQLFQSISASLDGSSRQSASKEHCIGEVKDEQDVVTMTRKLSEAKSTLLIVPILRISTVSGVGLQTLHCLLNALDTRITERSQSLGFGDRTHIHFRIDEIIELTHAGSILSGTQLSGTLRVSQHVNLGPDSNGAFQLMRIKTLRCNQVPVRTVSAGQTATIAVSLVRTTSELDARSSNDIDTDTKDEHESDGVISTIRKELREARLNCGVVRQLENATDLEGNVLLDESIGTTTHRSFTAILVLIGGQWPPRGLISGKWPPNQHPDSESDSGGSFGDLSAGRLRSCSPLRPKKRHQGSFVLGVYCEGIRQAANVLLMEEITHSDPVVDALPDSIKAAAAVPCKPDSDHASADATPCIARVGFQFQIKPEWLRIGSIIIVRDQTQGHLSGIGVISDLVQ